MTKEKKSPVREKMIEKISKLLVNVPHTINEDLSVNVDGNFNTGNSLKYLPFKINSITGNLIVGKKIISLDGCPVRVDGNFELLKCALTSLDNCPRYVGGNFRIFEVNIESLKGCPDFVGGWMDISSLNITSLEGCPERVNGNFAVPKSVISLIGSPRYIGGNFGLKYHKITSLKGCPDFICGILDCLGTHLTTLEYLPETIERINLNGSQLASVEHISHSIFVDAVYQPMEFTPIGELLTGMGIKLEGDFKLLNDYDAFRAVEGELTELYVERFEMFLKNHIEEYPNELKRKKFYEDFEDVYNIIY